MFEHESGYSADASKFHQHPLEANPNRTETSETSKPESFLDSIGHFEPDADDVEMIDAYAAENVDAAKPETNLASIDTIAAAYRDFLSAEDPSYAAQPGALEQKVAKFKKYFTENLGMAPINGGREASSHHRAEELVDRTEMLDFTGQAIFSDIDGTITDNSGELNPTAVKLIKDFMAAGGTFIPVTGRARFESVRKIVETFDVPFIVINNGAEIFDRNGNRVWGSEITDQEIETTFAVAEEEGLIWMQNKEDPQTHEEHLYSNFTEESEQAMLDVGIQDTVHNEEGRIGLQAVHVDSSVVKAIPGQNYKIQMMSPDPDAIQRAYDKFQAAGIPCMLNMQSPQDHRFHWVEVIRGTKISGIQTLIDNFLDVKITSASVVGDGGNDKTMFKDLRTRDGEPIINTRTAVKNACAALKEEVDKAIAEGAAQAESRETITTAGKHLDSSWDKLRVYDGESLEYSLNGGGSAISEMIIDAGRKVVLERTLDYMRNQWKLYQDIHHPTYHVTPDTKAAIHQAVQEFEDHQPSPTDPTPTTPAEAA